MKQPNSSRGREAAFRRDWQKRKGHTDPAADSPSTPDSPSTANSPSTTVPSSNGDTKDSAKPKRPDKQTRRKYLRQYVRWLWPYRWALGVVFLLALVSAVMDMVWPLAIKQIVDGVLLADGVDNAEKLRRLNLFGGGIVALLVLKELVETYRGYRTTVLNSKLVFRLRQKLFDRILGLPLGQIGDMKSGGIVSRLAGDVDSVSGLVQMALISPGVALIRVVLTAAILFTLSWRLALVASVLLPPLAALSFLWLRRVRPIYRSLREDNSNIDARVGETFGGIRVVRAFRREKREQRGYALGHHTIIRKRLYAERMELILSAVWGMLIPGTSLLIVWYGGRLFLAGHAGVGDIFAFQIYAVLLLQPVWQIVSSVSQTQKSLAAMERVFEVMEMPPDKPDAPDAVEAPPAVEAMRFDRVNFEYRAGVPVIRDFNLTVPGGSTVALVGPSGAGKTTLTDLVARFHDPASGAITLNGIDLRRLKLASYRDLLAVVQQETFLFDGTVRENISYGRRGATEDQVRDAARRANAHEFIDRLPEGYDTLIGERGFKLSGGQRQRISIARAILANPRILILDEATSNLDTESEQLIQASLADLFEGRTTFVIAHRLSTITGADLIVVMDEGRVVETGTHEQLMERRGLYHEMVERQRQSFGDAVDVVEQS
jgi:ATP-binding cassette subfamily B protein